MESEEGHKLKQPPNISQDEPLEGLGISWLPRLPFPLPATAAEAHSVIYASENFQDGVAFEAVGGESSASFISHFWAIFLENGKDKK